MKTKNKSLKMIIGIIAGILAFLVIHRLKAQPDATDKLIYNAYLSTEVNPVPWRKAVEARKRDYDRNQENKDAGIMLALAQFGLLSSTRRDQNESLFDEYYDGTVELLEKLNKADQKWAEPRALLSGTYGLKMAYSPIRGMFLGSKSSSLTDKAMELSPSSPLVWNVYAHSKFFTPNLFGGDLKEAIVSFEKCIRLYEANPSNLKFNWMYLDTLAWLGQAYLKNGDSAKSKEVFEKVLKVEPEFGWVRDVLLPQSKAKVNGR